MVKNEHFLIGISYNEYRPGMKLYLHQDHEGLNEGNIVEIKEVNGFNKETNSYKFPIGKGTRFFVTTNNVKIVWNEVNISCFIERNETTSFLESMFDHYKSEADKRMADFQNYEWTQNNYEHYLEDKHETLIEILVEYEHKRSFSEGGN